MFDKDLEEEFQKFMKENPELSKLAERAAARTGTGKSYLDLSEEEKLQYINWILEPNMFDDNPDSIVKSTISWDTLEIGKEYYCSVRSRPYKAVFKESDWCNLFGLCAKTTEKELGEWEDIFIIEDIDTDIFGEKMIFDNINELSSSMQAKLNYDISTIDTLVDNNLPVIEYYYGDIIKGTYMWDKYSSERGMYLITIKYMAVGVPNKNADSWGVYFKGSCVSKTTLKPGYENLPSNRTDEWLADHRMTFSEAIVLAKKAYTYLQNDLLKKYPEEDATQD